MLDQIRGNAPGVRLIEEFVQDAHSEPPRALSSNFSRRHQDRERDLGAVGRNLRIMLVEARSVRLAQTPRLTARRVRYRVSGPTWRESPIYRLQIDFTESV